jgi:hypothetical protein
MIKMMSFEEYLIMLDRERVTPSMMAKQMYERELIVKQLREEITDLKEDKDKVQNNWNELKKWLESKGTSTKDENDALCYFYTYKKMQELEGNNE